MDKTAFLLTAQRFARACELLCEGEKELDVSAVKWRWREVRGNGYLYLQITHRAHSPSRVEQSYNFDQIRDELEDESVKDSEEALDIDYGDLLEFRYFILFNETFSSPCLYFNCQYIDGSYIPIESLLSQLAIPNEEARIPCPVISQEEHHLLEGHLLYCLHPCNTRSILELHNFTQTQDTKKSESDINEDKTNFDMQFTVWLSLISRVTNLPLSAQLFKKICATMQNIVEI